MVAWRERGNFRINTFFFISLLLLLPSLFRNPLNITRVPILPCMKSANKQVTKEVKSYVKKTIKRNIETKIRDLDGYTTTGTNTGWILPYPSQGVTGVDRIGDKIRFTGFTMNYDVFTITAAQVTVRCVAVMCDSASALSFIDLFRGSPANYVQGIIDTNYVTVLHDEKYALSPNGLSSVSYNQTKKVNKFITFLQGSATPKQSYLHFLIFACDQTGVPQASLHRFVANFGIRFEDA